MVKQVMGKFKKGTSGNPAGRPKKRSIPQRIMDGWVSTFTGIGNSTYDKRLGHSFQADEISYEQAIDLWRGDDLAARTVDLPADDMTRAGFDFMIQDDEDDTKEAQEVLEDQWKDLGAIEAFHTALSYEAAYGGAAILIGAIDNAGDMGLPLEIDKVQSVDFLTVLERRELVPVYYYTDPTQPKYGDVSVYQLTPHTQGQDAEGSAVQAQNVHIHESRLIIMPGIRVTRQNLAGTDGWGDSKFLRLWRVLRDFNIAWDGTGILVSDFSQAVYKMKNLAALLNSDGGNSGLQTRLQGIEIGRSIVRATLIDAEDEYSRDTTNVTGLAELLQEYMVRMSSAADMPVTRLFGVSPGGLNATGESDIRMWYDRVASMQRRKVIPGLEYLTEILLAASGKAPAKWTVVARPLWQLSEPEIVTMRKAQAETDAIYMSNSVLSADEVAESRFKGDAYSIETVVDFSARESLEAELELEAEQEQLEAEQAALVATEEQQPAEAPAEVVPPKGG